MNFIINKEQYLALKARWAQQENKTAADHILYNVLRGFPTNRGFSPITDRTKLSNGATPWESYEHAKNLATHQIGEIIHYEHDDAIRRHRRETAFDSRINALNERYGIEFTPELRAAIRAELIK